MSVGILSQDHKGKWFGSRTEMCDWWEIRDNTYLGRINRGYSVEEALTKEVAEPSKPCTDHKGQHFKSQAELCRYYGIECTSFRDRLSRGWSLEDALTKEIVPQVNKREDRIGVTRTMKNGLKATIIQYDTAQSLTVQFEDGALGHGTMGNFGKGKIGHPTLHCKGHGTCCGFNTVYIGKDSEGNVWYETEKDGIKDIMTPQMMLAAVGYPSYA